MATAILTTPRAEPIGMEVPQAVRLLQFGDSMFPVGSFSFSNGLESAIQQGVVTDEVTLEGFVRTATRRSAASDGIALLHAHRAADDADFDRIVDADRAVYARKLNEEMRTQTVRTGKKLAEVATTVFSPPLLGRWLDSIGRRLTPGTYPVGLGVVGAELRLPEEQTFAIHQHGAAMTILSAALRLMRVDHLATQAILYAVNTEVDADYADASSATLGDMASFAPVTDFLAAVHVRSHVRMFMN